MHEFPLDPGYLLEIFRRMGFKNAFRFLRFVWLGNVNQFKKERAQREASLHYSDGVSQFYFFMSQYYFARAEVFMNKFFSDATVTIHMS